MICVDGGSGLLAVLPNILPGIPVQRCWAHKIRNVLNKVRRADQPKVKRALHKIMNAPTQSAARSAARRFADRFQNDYPAAVACLRNDLDELLTCFRYKSEDQRRKVQMQSNDASAKYDDGPGPWELPGQNLHGPHSVGRLHPRKQVTRRPGPGMMKWMKPAATDGTNSTRMVLSKGRFFGVPDRPLQQ